MNLVNEIPEAFEVVSNVLVPGLKGYAYVANSNEFALYPFEMYPGGFCQSFPMARSGVKTKKCLRLWVNDTARESNLVHIKSVSDYFNRHKVNYVIRYEYVEQALRLLNGKVIPGVVMDWIEGDTLINDVKKNYRNATRMRALAKAFREMIDYLNRNGMAHGDLSGDNIMVTPQRQLVLIDYDSFYVKGQPANIQQPTAGIKAFQHPQRGTNRYLNTYMDFFSQQVIYLSLLAIAEKPDLFDVDTDKGLLFQDADLRNEAALIQSTAYKGISTIGNTEVKARLADLRKDIAVPFDKVRSLTAIYDWEAELERRRKEGRSKPKTDIQVPPRKDKEPVREVKTLAPFCGICGYQFPTSGDNANYCPMCGTQRRTLEQNQLPPWRTDNSPYQGGTKKR